MIDRLRRALEHIEELSPEAQEDLAQQIEELTEPLETMPGSRESAIDETLPPLVRRALALDGAWSDLQGDDEFEALDRICHSSAPTPPIDKQLSWLDENEQ